MWSKTHTQLSLTGVTDQFGAIIEVDIGVQSLPELHGEEVVGRPGPLGRMMILPLLAVGGTAGSRLPLQGLPLLRGPGGDVTGGGEVETSCFRVSSYFAFSVAYLYGQMKTH